MYITNYIHIHCVCATYCELSLHPGTALHYACREGRTEIAKQLIEAHAPLDVMAETDFTPLHVATQGGHVEMVKVLLAAGADPDVPSRFERRSAVILAALDGWEMVLSVLLTGKINCCIVRLL